MSKDRSQILRMLKEGKISVEEAEELLDAIGDSEDVKVEDNRVTVTKSSGSPKYLRVQIDSEEDGKPEKVNVRVPLQLLRAGVKLASVLPHDSHGKVSHALHEKGFDFDLSNIKSDDLDSLIEALTDMSIDIDSDDSKVKVFCE